MLDTPLPAFCSSSGWLKPSCCPSARPSQKCARSSIWGDYNREELCLTFLTISTLCFCRLWRSSGPVKLQDGTFPTDWSCSSGFHKTSTFVEHFLCKMQLSSPGLLRAQNATSASCFGRRKIWDSFEGDKNDHVVRVGAGDVFEDIILFGPRVTTRLIDVHVVQAKNKSLSEQFSTRSAASWMVYFLNCHICSVRAMSKHSLWQ